MGQERFPGSILLTVIVRVSALMRARVRASSGLDTAGYRVLSALRRAGAGMSAGDLASTLRIPTPAVSESAKALARAGLVERARDDSDRRRVLLRTTASGTKLAARADDALGQLVAALWRGLDDDLMTVSLRGTAAIDDSYKPNLSRAGTKFVSLFFETYHISNRLLTDSVRQAGMSVGAYRVLKEAAELGDRAVGMKLVAHRLLMPANALTVAVDELEEEGLAERGQSFDDLRALTVSPTALGLERLDDAAQIIEYAMVHHAEGISDKDRELQTFQAVTVYRNLQVLDL